MTAAYPQLDISTIWRIGAGAIFAAGLHSPVIAAAPRSYVHHIDQETVFFSGCPVECTGRFAAHRAEGLATNWVLLPETLEGPYGLVRLNFARQELEVITDFLGLEQVYYCQLGDGWLVSNSVAVLRRLGASAAWDELGVSLFLSLGWASADRTLHSDIRVIPAGQHWTWRPGSERCVLDRRTWYSILDQPKTPSEKRKPNIQCLAADLANIVQQVHAQFGSLVCPITGGRDSRLLAALLVHAGVPARYGTAGDAESADVQIAGEVAAIAGLPHELWSLDTKMLLAEWKTLSKRLVTQNDGMVSLWQIQDIASQPNQVEHLDVTLPGFGGEIARGYLSDPQFYLTGMTEGAVWRMLCSRLIHSGDGLVRPDAIESARIYLRDTAQKIARAGFAPIDIPDIFYVQDRVARWIGSNIRKVYPVGDLFAPLATRPFVQAAFQLSAYQRFTEPLHHDLLTFLAPDLHRLRFAQGPWRSQVPAWSLARWAMRQPLRWGAQLAGLRRNRPTPRPAFSQAAWLYNKRGAVREMMLQYPSSELWNYIDRSRFEHLTSEQLGVDDVTPVAEQLYLATTLLEYASLIA